MDRFLVVFNPYDVVPFDRRSRVLLVYWPKMVRKTRVARYRPVDLGGR